MFNKGSITDALRANGKIPPGWMTISEIIDEFYLTEQPIRKMMAVLAESGKARQITYKGVWITERAAFIAYKDRDHGNARYPAVIPWLKAHPFEATYWPYSRITEKLQSMGMDITKNMVMAAARRLKIKRCGFNSIAWKKGLRAYVDNWLRKKTWLYSEYRTSVAAFQQYVNEDELHPPQYRSEYFGDSFWSREFFKIKDEIFPEKAELARQNGGRHHNNRIWDMGVVPKEIVKKVNANEI